LDSSLGASMGSLAIRRPLRLGPPKASLTPISGSLPITMSKPRPLPSLSSIFGGKKNDAVSKSWSDLWDEDIEEEEETEKQIKARQMQNARTWSHESKSEDDTLRQIPMEESKDSSPVNISKLNLEAVKEAAKSDVDEDLVADGFFFHDVPKATKPQPSPRYSPPPKRTSFDKWSALGERRRAYTGTSESEKSPDLWKSRRNVGLGFSGFGASVWDSKANNVFKDNGAKAIHSHTVGNKACPWSRDRVRDHHYSHGKDKRQVDLGDLEWVGGWNDLHL